MIKRAWRNPFSVIITGFYSIIKCTVLIAEGANADFEKQIKNVLVYIVFNVQFLTLCAPFSTTFLHRREKHVAT
jgi:hypothetical protein